MPTSRPLVFWLPKQGHAPTEYEDAVAWRRTGGRFAVADGASESSFARLWAYLLAWAYTGGQLTVATLEADLRPVQARWRQLVARRPQPLPWYLAEKVRQGAFAALVGLTLAEDGGWAALAVGDCCLFQVRGDQLLAAFPLTCAAAFGMRPLLLSSEPARNARLRAAGAIAATDGTWQPEDTFLLMSDALAAHFLGQTVGEGCPPLAALAFERTRAGFKAWVRALREQRRLRNDDVSLLWLEASRGATA